MKERDTPVPPEPPHQQVKATTKSQEMPAARGISQSALRMRSALEQLEPTPAAGTEMAIADLKFRGWQALLLAEKDGDIGQLFAALSLMARQQGVKKLAQALRLALATQFGP